MIYYIRSMACSGCNNQISTTRTIINGLRAAPRIAMQVAFGKYVDLKEKTRRMTICEGCPNFQSHDKRCIQCTCYLDKKTVFTNEHCPIGKW